MGFEVRDSSKRTGSIYVDGHERSDVVAYRTKFVRRFIDDYLPAMELYDGDDMMDIVLPSLNEQDKQLVSRKRLKSNASPKRKPWNV